MSNFAISNLIINLNKCQLLRHLMTTFLIQSPFLLKPGLLYSPLPFLFLSCSHFPSFSPDTSFCIIIIHQDMSFLLIIIIQESFQRKVSEKCEELNVLFNLTRPGVLIISIIGVGIYQRKIYLFHSSLISCSFELRECFTLVFYISIYTYDFFTVLNITFLYKIHISILYLDYVFLSFFTYICPQYHFICTISQEPKIQK